MGKSRRAPKTRPSDVSARGRGSANDTNDVELPTHSVPLGLGRLLDERAEELDRTGGLSHEEFWHAVDERYGRDPNSAENEPS
jgi:hypothetical protein